MRELLVNVHDVFRWVVLAAAVFALALSVMAATGNRPWDALSDRASLIFTITMDIQLLIGLVLWVVEQRWTVADANITWLHPLAMIVAVALAHVGRARSDRAETSRLKGLTATQFFLASLVVVLIAIPLYAWPL